MPIIKRVVLIAIADPHYHTIDAVKNLAELQG